MIESRAHRDGFCDGLRDRGNKNTYEPDSQAWNEYDAAIKYGLTKREELGLPRRKNVR